LLIGGSPCQGFSLLGKQLNFDDPRSKLFFEYVRVLNDIKLVNSNVKFLLENVKMKQEYANVISETLGCQPIRINSSLISACKRDRLYWTNIENVSIPQVVDISFDDINCNSNQWLSKEYIGKVKNWKAQQDPIKSATRIGTKSKLPCLTARGYNQSHSGMSLITNGEDYRYLTNEEAELAMTLPVGYTKGFSDKIISHAIGNGWHIKTIEHIFKNLQAK
jgi:site-specific DNA-cytosine methylase